MFVFWLFLSFSCLLVYFMYYYYSYFKVGMCVKNVLIEIFVTMQYNLLRCIIEE